MDKLKELYAELYKLPAPKGFTLLAEDLDILVYQYADHVMGLVNSYLAGKKIDFPIDDQGKDLSQKIEKCQIALNELLMYKQKYDGLNKLLIENMSKDLNS